MNNQSIGENNRLYWLDTIKGISCWVVFLGHFRIIHTYIPLISEFADPKDYLSFIYNETVALNVFYVVSAFFAARAFMNADTDFRKRAGSSIIKRYFRLSIPVFISEFLIFIFQNIGFWSDGFDRSPARKINFFEIVYDSFFKSPFYGSDSVNLVFWMIFILFWGHVVVIVECAIVSSIQKKYRYIFLVALLLILSLVKNDFAPFTFGLFLYLVYTDLYADGGTEKKKNIPRYIIGGFLILAGSYFSGQDGQIAYLFIKNGYTGFSTESYAYCWVAAFLILLGIVLCTPVMRILDNKRISALGKICFPVYLFHLVCILSFGAFAYDRVTEIQGMAVHATKASLLVSFIATVLISVIYVKYIEPEVNKLTAAIVKKIT